MSQADELQQRLRRVLRRHNEGWQMDATDGQSVADAIAYLNEKPQEPMNTYACNLHQWFGTGPCPTCNTTVPASPPHAAAEPAASCRCGTHPWSPAEQEKSARLLLARTLTDTEAEAVVLRAALRKHAIVKLDINSILPWFVCQQCESEWPYDEIDGDERHAAGCLAAL